MSKLLACPQCPWMGYERDLTHLPKDDGEASCPRCGALMSAPKTMISLDNLILFGFTLDTDQLYYKTDLENDKD